MTLPDVTELAIPGFVALALVELAMRHRRGRTGYETRDTVASLAMGVGNLVEGILLGGIGYATLAWAHSHAILELSGTVPMLIAAFVLDDLRYYVYHRIAHERRWFWAAHVTHHSSQHYNLSTALRQTWGSTLTGAFLFRVPLAWIGFSPEVLAFVASLNLVYQFWIHTEGIDRLPWPIEAVFNTPSHHRVHHARNPRYLDANYAGTFIVWDRLFSTFVPEDPSEPCRYGLVKNIGSFNPLRIAFHEMIAMARDATRRGISVGDRWRYLAGPPGFSHDGTRRTSAQIRGAWRDRQRRRSQSGSTATASTTGTSRS